MTTPETKKSVVGGAELLREFMERKRLVLREVAEAMRVRESNVWSWREGTARPEALNRKALDRWTDSQVPEESWLTQEEREFLWRVRPFRRQVTVEHVKEGGDVAEH